MADASTHPFANREVRIRRREERNLFRRRLMPMMWFLSAVGSAGLLVLFGYYLLYHEWPYQAAGPCFMLVALPFVFMAIGWVRGHHDRRLEEP